MPDYPTRMSISATICLSSSCSHQTCYLQDRDEIADDVIIAKPRNRYLKVTVISVQPLTVQSGINPRATVASIKVFFRVITASIQPHFALSHAQALGILHYHECYIAPMQGNLPTSRLNATVRAAFIPDFTLEFLPIFSSRKRPKMSILVVFSTHSSGLTLGNPLSAFRHEQNPHADFSTTFSVFSAVICPFPTPWVLSFISRILMVAKISFRSSAKDILLMYIRSICSLSLGSVL